MHRSQVVIFKMRNATLDPIWNKHTWQYENVYTCWTWNNTQTLIWTLCGKRCICRLIFFKRCTYLMLLWQGDGKPQLFNAPNPIFFHSKNLLLHFWHIMLPMHILPEECTTLQYFSHKWYHFPELFLIGKLSSFCWHDFLYTAPVLSNTEWMKLVLKQSVFTLRYSSSWLLLDI